MTNVATHDRHTRASDRFQVGRLFRDVGCEYRAVHVGAALDDAVANDVTFGHLHGAPDIFGFALLVGFHHLCEAPRIVAGEEDVIWHHDCKRPISDVFRRGEHGVAGTSGLLLDDIPDASA